MWAIISLQFQRCEAPSLTPPAALAKERRVVEIEDTKIHQQLPTLGGGCSDSLDAFFWVNGDAISIRRITSLRSISISLSLSLYIYLCNIYLTRHHASDERLPTIERGRRKWSLFADCVWQDYIFRRHDYADCLSLFDAAMSIASSSFHWFPIQNDPTSFFFLQVYGIYCRPLIELKQCSCDTIFYSFSSSEAI